MQEFYLVHNDIGDQMYLFLLKYNSVFSISEFFIVILYSHFFLQLH